jgi:hypothetical protein
MRKGSVWEYMSVIPARWKVEVGESQSEAREILSQKPIKVKMALPPAVEQMEYLPSKQEALSSISMPRKNKQTRSKRIIID